MTASAIEQPARARPLGAILPAIFWGTALRAKVTAGLVILILWQVGVTLFAPAFVATPIGVIIAFPEVVTSQIFLRASAGTLVAVFQGLAIALVVGTVVGVGDGADEGVRPGPQFLCRRVLHHADDRVAAADHHLVRLWRRRATGDDHFRRVLLDRDQCARWCAFGAAGISGGLQGLPCKGAVRLVRHHGVFPRCPTSSPASASRPAGPWWPR